MFPVHTFNIIFSPIFAYYVVTALSVLCIDQSDREINTPLNNPGSASLAPCREVTDRTQNIVFTTESHYQLCVGYVFFITFCSSNASVTSNTFKKKIPRNIMSNVLWGEKTHVVFFNFFSKVSMLEKYFS